MKPEDFRVRFSLDTSTGKYDARAWITLTDSIKLPGTASAQGLSITDLKFRALGRSWLSEHCGTVELVHEALMERLNADALYLTMGLSRQWRGRYWPLVHAVHIVPDYEAVVRLDCL